MIDRKMNNKAEEIKELLALYYEGKTTKSQEDMLCEYFASNSIPEELSIDKEIFCALTSSMDSIELPEGFEQRMDRAIDCASNENRRKRIIVGGVRRRIIHVAASLMLLIAGLSIIFYESSQNPYEVTDPKIAYAKTEEALLKVSENLKKVDSEIAKADRLLGKLNKKSK